MEIITSSGTASPVLTKSDLASTFSNGYFSPITSNALLDSTISSIDTTSKRPVNSTAITNALSNIAVQEQPVTKSETSNSNLITYTFDMDSSVPRILIAGGTARFGLYAIYMTNYNYPVCYQIAKVGNPISSTSSSASTGTTITITAVNSVWLKIFKFYEA